jgi:Ca2+-binding RTX toxin-like protein
MPFHQPIEPLETRTLLAANLAGGVLTVTGTDQNDHVKIFVSRDGTKLVVKDQSADDSDSDSAGKVSALRKGGGKVAPKPVGNGKRGPKGGGSDDNGAGTTEFVLADVDSIVINAGAGNDQVTLRGRRKALLDLPATINGGDGNDHLRGGAADDVINGDAGNDKIEGNGGDDDLFGGDGRDMITGGLGDDLLSGGNGNDVLNSADRDGTDTVDGGAHDATPTGKDDQPIGDRAAVDANDVVTNVERTKTLKNRRGPKK